MHTSRGLRRFGNNRVFVGRALVVALGLVYGASVSAQDSADSSLKRVEVTGSRLLSLNAESAAPVQIFSAEEIAASGAANLQELLLKNPVFGTPGYSRTNSNFNNESAGVSTVDLRNLGSSRTLVLVNGRRYISGLPGDSAVDLNTIPADFIDRVEILTGGASSAYGSDAVAGVVNIILKKSYEGFTIDAQTGQSERGDDTKHKVSVTTGAKSEDGRASLMGHFSVTRQGAVYSRDRDISAVDQASKGTYITGDSADIFTVQRPFFSSYAPQGRFYPTTSSKTLDSNGNLIPFSTNGPAGDGVGATGFNRSTYRTIAIPVDRTMFALNGEYQLKDSHTAFFEGTFANSKTKTALEPYPLASTDLTGRSGSTGIIPAQTLVNGVKIANPLIPTALFNLMTDKNGDGLTDYTFTRRMSDIGGRGNQADRDTFRVLGGVKGDINPQWAYEAYMGYGFTKEGQTSTGQVNVMNFWNALNVITDTNTGAPICADATARLQGCVPANIFGANKISAAAAAYISAPGSLNTKVTQELAGGVIRGEPFTVPAGPVQVAFGGEYRKEGSATEHDALTIAGLNAGNALPNTAGSFSVTEGFVEARVPLAANVSFAKSLDAVMAIRSGNYSTVGNTVSYNAGLDWAPNSTFRFRTTSSLSVRAPNINDLYAAPAQTFPTGLVDPCEGVLTSDTSALAVNCKAATGVTANMVSNSGEFTLGQADQQGISGYDSGNPNLKSEKGTSVTVGIVVTPRNIPVLEKFTFTADYYDIQIDDAIRSQGRQYLLDQCYRLGDTASCQFIKRRAFAAGGYSVGSLDTINQVQVNSGGTHASGLDLTATYADRIGSGMATAKLSYSKLFDLSTKLTPTSDTDPVAGEVGASKDRWMLNLGYKWGDYALNTTVTYIGESYLDDQFMKSMEWDYETGKIPAITYIDVQGTYNINKKSQVYFGVNNLMDTRPPLIPSGLSGNVTGAETDSGTYDAIGRRFYIGMRYTF